MNAPKRLVLDANILLRAVFGTRVYQLLNFYGESVEFFTSDVCLADATRHIPRIAAQRQSDPTLANFLLSQIVPGIVEVVDSSLYEEFESRARARIAKRDPDDWPVVATALLLDAPIWTEDKDFFGSGIATWTSQTVELYLKND